jgi:hypothetical protein
MKQILITVFKGLLVLTVLALVVLLVFGLVMMAGWTWWAGFFCCWALPVFIWELWCSEST